MKEQSLRLFAETPVPAKKNLLSTPPRLTLNAPDADPQPAHVPAPVAASTASVSLEREILSVLEESPIPGERTAEAFRRKEHLVGNLFAALSVEDARTLHRRLSCPSKTDLIVTQMARLAPDRRARLIAFLGDARLRAALSGRKGR